LGVPTGKKCRKDEYRREPKEAGSSVKDCRGRASCPNEGKKNRRRTAGKEKRKRSYAMNLQNGRLFVRRKPRREGNLKEGSCNSQSIEKAPRRDIVSTCSEAQSKKRGGGGKVMKAKRTGK